MEEKEVVQMPCYIHEMEMARQERMNKRWFIAFIIVLVTLFVTNGMWIAYELQFDTYYIEQEADTGNGTAIINGIGDVSYGEGQADSTR